MKNGYKRPAGMLAIMLLMGSAAAAQQGKDDVKEIKIRIEKDVNGNKTVQERTVNVAGMNDEERQAVMDSVSRELSGNEFSQKRVKVIIEDDAEMNGNTADENRFEWRSNDNEDVRVYRFRGEQPHVIIQREDRGNRSDWDSGKVEEDIEIHMERMGNRMREMGEEIPRRLNRMVSPDMVGQGNTVRGLSVFPNRPDTHILNVRFFTPDAGNVGIKVLNVDGKVIATENLQNFKGDYVGQLTLTKGSTGTFFVMVTQNNDGVTNRVVLE